MLIKHVMENQDGTLEFTGVLKDDELAFVVETGLNIILAHGALAYEAGDEETEVVVQ